MLNYATTTYDDDDSNDDGWGGLTINRNDDDDNDGVRSDFVDDLIEYNVQTQQAIWHGMVGTYYLFPSLYIQWGYGSDKLE